MPRDGPQRQPAKRDDPVLMAQMTSKTKEMMQKTKDVEMICVMYLSGIINIIYIYYVIYICMDFQ